MYRQVSGLTTIFFSILIFVNCPISGEGRLRKDVKIEDCVEDEGTSLCFHCDSKNDTHCEDPFQFSFYYANKPIYLAECFGCCIKIIHPKVGNETRRRIQRSCVDFLPADLTFSVEGNCGSVTENERRICLCKHNLCNGMGVAHPQISLIFGTCMLVLTEKLYKMLSY